jgi:hypothetical protein
MYKCRGRQDAVSGDLLFISSRSLPQYELHTIKNLCSQTTAEVLIKSLAVTYFHMGTPTLSSALSSFTSEFEMGSGGSHLLMPPGKLFTKKGIHLFPHIREVVKASMLPALTSNTNCLGVIWSSLTGN